VLASGSDVMTLAAGGDIDMTNKVHVLIDAIRREQSGISDAAL
jgi:hypothetical protein